MEQTVALKWLRIKNFAFKIENFKRIWKTDYSSKPVKHYRNNKRDVGRKFIYSKDLEKDLC